MENVSGTSKVFDLWSDENFSGLNQLGFIIKDIDFKFLNFFLQIKL
jgi:hypothetical protein